MKKNRTTLKERFKKGAIPTEADFADLIDSMLNQAEDNISKLPSDPLKITATGVDEALLNFYRIENNDEKLSWQIRQKPDGKAGLTFGDTVANRVFIESGTGNVGVGTTTPRARLQVLGGALMPDAGNSEAAGILFPPDAGGGSGDRAWMRYYARSGESMTLELGTSNDPDDHIAMMPSGNVGIGSNAPLAKLDILQEARSGTHPAAVKGLYVTGAFSPDSEGVEFRHSNGSQGLGFGYNTIYAAGTLANQDIGLKPRGSGKINLNGPLQVTGAAQANAGLTVSNGLQVSGNSKVTGALQVSGGVLTLDGAQKLQFADGDSSNNLKLQLWTGYGLGINDSTLFYAAGGQHSWRDASGVNERMNLTTAATGGLTVKGTGNSSFGGSLGIGTTAPKAKLQVVGGAIMPDAGNSDAAGILFPLDPGGGSGDKAWIRYYARTGESTTMELGTSNDADDHIALMPSGNVGIGSVTPIARLDVLQEARSGAHPPAVKGLYVTGAFGADSDGVEFRHSNGSQGLGFGFNTIYAAGTNATQDIGLKPRGGGRVLVTGDMQVSGVVSGPVNDYFKAQATMSGGGTVSWAGGGGRLKWSNRFIAISMEKQSSFSNGYVDIYQPSADIPAAQVYDGVARSANATGVVLNGWEALYAVHTIGGDNSAVSFRIVRYTNPFTAPSNWLLVAVVNGDDNTVKLGTGLIISANSASSQGSHIPVGVITMWSGASNNLPGGWALCDGGNGTPNLRDRFIVGAGNAYGVGATGGAATVALGIEHMPSHNHNNGNFSQLLEKRGDGQWTASSADNTVGEPDIVHAGTILPAGGGQAHENRPPYYALAYIMKL